MATGQESPRATTLQRLDDLEARREVLLTQLQGMLAEPGDQPTGEAALRAWRREVQGKQVALEQIDRLLATMNKSKRATRVAAQPAPADARDATAQSTDVVLLARIPKGQRAELRVEAKTWKGRRVIDVRCWAAPKGSSEFGPTRKGVAIDAKMLPALVEALRLAVQHA